MKSSLCNAAMRVVSGAAAVALPFASIPAMAAPPGGPGIYSWVMPISHGINECVRKARVIASNYPEWRVVNGTQSLYMSSRSYGVSYQIRCDIAGYVVLIVAGELNDQQIQARTNRLRDDYIAA